MLFRQNINKILRALENKYVTHNRIEVSRSALLHNLDVCIQLSKLPAIPVLKGNAYGHGIAVVAAALKNSNVPYIAVDSYFEALRVRETTSKPVLIMGAISPENYGNIKYDNFAFVVQDEESIRALGATGKNIKIHLEANTGMNRYGAEMNEIVKLAKLIMQYDNLTLEGVMSHLADSDGEDPTTVNIAVEKFDECVEAIRKTGASPTLLHIAQSAGSIKAQSKYANAFRLGIGLYGINPFPRNHKLNQTLKNLQPALKLISTITKIINLKRGDGVSYNYTFIAPKDMTIGVLPLGYYEGIPRSLSNAGVVKIGNSFAHIIGKICMNHTIISLDGISANVGDEVIVYSDNPADKNAIDTIAHEKNLFNYSLATSLNQDVRRVLTE